jgi:hypothetical protein
MCYNLLSDFGRRRLWAFNWRKYPMICRRCHDDLAGGVDGVRGRDQRLPRTWLEVPADTHCKAIDQ